MRKKRPAPLPSPVARPLVAARDRVASIPTAASLARALAAIGGTLVVGVAACNRRESPTREQTVASASTSASASPSSSSSPSSLATATATESPSASTSSSVVAAAVSCSASVHVFPHVTASANPFAMGTIDNFPNVAGGYAPVSPVTTLTAGATSIGSLGTSKKGDDAAPTQPRVGEATVTVTGDLDPVVVRRIVHARFAAFKACYAKGLKANPALHGVINTSFVIAAAGGVSTASTSSSTGDAAMDACVRAAFQSLAFPSASAPTTVAYPLIFTTTSSA